MSIFTLGFSMYAQKKILFFITIIFSFSLIIIFLITLNFILSFEKISFYEYDILLKQRMSIKDQNNDIIIIGDSSGLNGLIANKIQKSIGLNTINLSLYANNGIESYEILLKKYLEKNKKPKKIILYFSYFSPNNWKNITYEKSILIFRYANLNNKINFILKNPYSVILIINRSVRATLRYFIFAKKQLEYAEKIREELKKTKGFIVSNTEKKENLCNRVAREVFTEDFGENIIKIKSTFSNYDIKVYLAPIPKCVYKKNVYAKLYQDIIDNDLYFLEKKYFNDFSHLTLSGAIKNSFIFSDWIVK